MKLEHRNRGYHDNQSDNSIVAIVDGEVVGFLDYSEYRGEIHIQMIEVDKNFRRQGIGTALLKELDKEYPEVEIEYGMETPEGARLIEEYQRRYPKKLDFERGFSNRDFVLSFVPDYGKNADKVSWHSLSFAFSETGLDLDKYDFNWEPGKKQFEQDIKRVTDKGWAAAAKQLRSDLGIKHNAEMRVASISAGVKDERRWDTDRFPKRLSPTWEMPTLGDEPLSEITTTWRSVNPQERGKHLMMSRELLKVAKDLLAANGISIREVKKMARKYGADFFKGHGYFYFTAPSGLVFREEGVYVFDVNELTLEQWEEELKGKIEEARK